MSINAQEEAMKVINIILEMYPNLEKDREDIVGVVLENYDRKRLDIYSRIKINGEILYVNQEGVILDAKLKWRGQQHKNRYYLDDGSSYDIVMQQ